MFFRKRLRTTGLLLFIYALSFGQISDSISNEYFIMEQIESTVDESNSGANFQDILDQYNYLSQHPLQINLATKEELSQVHFFTPLQIQQILDHRKIYGSIVDKKELLYLGFTPQQFLLIEPIIRLDKTTLPKGKLLSSLSHQLLFRNSFVINKQKGYSGLSDNQYLGDRNKLYTRYRVQNQKVSFGFTLEKDAGEQLFNNSAYSSHKGIDFMSGHLKIAPNKYIKEIILGDYSLNFGQGLVLWNGFSTRKSALSLNVEKLGFSTRPYTSVNESSFLRGGMIQLNHHNVDLYLFSSFRKLDANITQIDSLDNSPTEFSSFQTSGFHRTQSELIDRKKITQYTNGGRVRYSTNKISIASTISFFNYDVPLTKGNKLYQQHDPEGNHFHNIGIDIGYNFEHSRLFGEVATSSNNGKAGIIGYQWHPSSSITHIISARSLSKEYYTPYGNIFSESGRTKNETGLYNGFEWQINRYFSSTFYADYYKFEQPTFSNNTPTNGSDYVVQINYNISDKTTLYSRLKYETKSGSFTPESKKISSTTANTINRFRVHLTHSPTEKLTLKTRAELFWGNNKQQPEKGYLLYQDIKFKTRRFSYTGRVAQFSTSSFSSAIYAYEADVLYSFSVLPYYYQGSKFYLLIKYKINKHLALWAKYSETIFDNQTSIGSGLEEINGNRKQHFKFQIEWKF